MNLVAWRPPCRRDLSLVMNQLGRKGGRWVRAFTCYTVDVPEGNGWGHDKGQDQDCQSFSGLAVPCGLCGGLYGTVTTAVIFQRRRESCSSRRTTTV